NLSAEERLHIAGTLQCHDYAAGDLIYRIDDPLGGVFIVLEGEVESTDRQGALVSLLTARDTFGERGFLRDGQAATTTRASRPSRIAQLPAAEFRRLLDTYISFPRYFQHHNRPFSRTADIRTPKVSTMPSTTPLHCPPHTSVAQGARLMRDNEVSARRGH